MPEFLVGNYKNSQVDPFREIESDRCECFLLFLRYINHWFRLFSQQIESNVPIKLKFAVLISINRSQCELSPNSVNSRTAQKTTERETTLRVKCTQSLRSQQSTLPAINRTTDRSFDVLTTWLVGLFGWRIGFFLYFFACFTRNSPRSAFRQQFHVVFVPIKFVSKKQ